MSNQLIKTTGQGKENVFPRTRIQDLFDDTSGQKLIDILKSFNMMFVPYLGNKSYTRNQISPELRRQGLWLTYVIGNTVYTEWYDEVAIDDTNWGSDSNWRQGSNALVGDLSISSNGTWVINGEDSGITIKGDKGDSPVIRIYDNKIQVSYDKGVTYEDLNNTPVYTKFRFNSQTNTYQVSYDLGANWQDISDEKVYHKFRYNNTTNTYQESIDFGKTWSNISAEKVYYQFRYNAETNTHQVSTDLGQNWTDVSSNKVYYQFRTEGNRLQVSTDLGNTWENCSEPIAAWFRWADVNGTGNVGKVQISRDSKIWSDLSPTMTNNLYIKGYVATVGNLPSNAAIGDIYMVGPTYDESDITHDYPHYRMWVKQSSGWVDNGEFTNAGPVSTNNIIDRAVTLEKIADNAIDDKPTDGSENLVKSGGIYKAINIPITENISANAIIIEAYCANGLPNGSRLRIRNNTNNLQVGVVDNNDAWIAVNYIQPTTKGIVILNEYNGNASTSPYATKVLLYADFNNYNSSDEISAKINIIYVNDVRYSVRIKEYLDTQNINSSINELNTKVDKNTKILDSNALGIVSSGPDLSLFVKEIYVKSVSLSDVTRFVYFIARDKNGDGSVYDSVIRLVTDTGKALVVFYDKKFNTSDYNSANAARQAAIDDLNYIYITLNGDGIVLNKDNLIIGSVVDIHCNLYNSCANKYVQPSIFNATNIVKFTENYDVNKIIKELYTKGDIYTGTFFRMQRLDNITQITIMDNDSKVIASGYIDNVSSFNGYIKLNATSGSSPIHAAYRTDYYTYIQFDNYKDINKAVLCADIVHDPKNSLLCYIESQRITNLQENKTNIEDSFICSKIFDKNKTEKFAHNQNCDFDNMGNCLLLYCFNNSNFEESEYGGAKKLVKFNVTDPNNIILVKEWVNYSDNGEHMHSMPSPFFDGTMFRILYSDKGTLYIADETFNNPVIQTINNVPFTIENYNSILSSVFGINSSDANYQYFSAEGSNFYLQTKIYYYSSSNEYYLLISSFRGPTYNYKVPMLLKSTDLINWTPVLLLHKYDSDNNRIYIKSKAEHSIACKNGKIYIAVRGGDSDFSSTPVVIFTGTTIIAYELDGIDNNSIPFYLETIKASYNEVICEGKPFVDFVGNNPIVLATKGEDIYDSYKRNSIAVFDCSKRVVIANINRSSGIHYIAGRSYSGGINITFVEDFRNFFTTQNTPGKYSNIRYAKLSI